VKSGSSAEIKAATVGLDRLVSLQFALNILSQRISVESVSI
jgi:hypothetical protein